MSFEDENDRMTLFEIEVFLSKDGTRIGVHAGIGAPIEELGPQLQSILDGAILFITQKINEYNGNVGFSEACGPGINEKLKQYLKGEKQNGKTWH